MKLLTSLICLLSIPLKGFGSSAVMVRGMVQDAGTGDPLIGVTVYTADKKAGIATDASGRFSLSVQAPVVLVFSYVGYASMEKQVEREGEMTIRLKTASRELHEITVAAKDESHASMITASVLTLTPKQLGNLPSVGGEKDIVAAMQLMPGIKKGADGGAGMYVRGGTSDQNLVLLDGVTIYNPSHAVGFFSVFNPDVVKEVKLWKGAFPATYGGRISSVMDVSLRNAATDKWSGRLFLGSVSARCLVEGPVVRDRVSILIAARRTYLDRLLSVAKIDLPYYFYDLNLKANIRLSERHSLTVSQFAGNDVVKLAKAGGEQDKSLSIDFGTVLGNRVTAANWAYGGPRFRSLVTAGFSNYRYDIDARIKDSYFTLSSSISDVSLRSMVTQMTGRQASLSYGAEYSRIWMKPNQSTVHGALNGSIRASDGQYFSLHTAAVFLSHDVRLRKQWALNYGLRLGSSFSPSSTYVVPEPRLSLTYNWSESLSLKASWNKMSQHLHLVTSSSGLLPTDLWYPVSKDIRPQECRQFALTIDKRLHGSEYVILFDAYYKQMNQLVEYREGTQLLLNDAIEKDLIQGKGRSYGFELSLQKNNGKLKGWIGYTLSWSERQFDALNEGEYFYTRYDRRHDISLVASYDFGKRISVAGTWVWASGSRVTPIVGQFLMPSGSYNEMLTLPVYGKRNSLVLSPSHRLDLNLVIRSKTGKKYASELHIGAYNVYNQTQPYRIRVLPDDKGNLVYKQTGLFGFIPSVSYQISF